MEYLVVIGAPVILRPDLRSLKLFVNKVPSFWIKTWTRIEDSSNDSIQPTLDIIASRMANLQELALMIENPGKEFNRRALVFRLILL